MPRLDFAAHLDEEAAGAGAVDGDMGTHVEMVAGSLDVNLQVKLSTAHWQVPRQRPSLKHDRQGFEKYNKIITQACYPHL